MLNIAFVNYFISLASLSYLIKKKKQYVLSKKEQKQIGKKKKQELQEAALTEAKTNNRKVANKTQHQDHQEKLEASHGKHQHKSLTIITLNVYEVL